MNYIKEENRIYCVNEKNDVIAEITFKEVKKGVFDINHTFVDESLRGQGIAKELVKMAVEEIENKKGIVTASCSYAKKLL